MEILFTIGFSLFPVGILLGIVLSLFGKHIPDPIDGYLTLVAIASIWVIPILSVPFMVYEFFVWPMAFYLGFEWPSFL